MDRLAKPWDGQKKVTDQRDAAIDDADGGKNLNTRLRRLSLFEEPKSPSGIDDLTPLMRKSKSEIHISKDDLELFSLLEGPTSKHQTHYSTSQSHWTVLPPGFRQEIQQRLAQGRITDAVAKYYLEIMPRGDSNRLPGQNGRPSLLEAILTEKVQSLPKELSKGHEWRPRRIVGKGAYGSVILWEKVFADGRAIRLASKDTKCSALFRDYCSEAQLTRRLNDVGCKNVISVVEWKHMGDPTHRTLDGAVHNREPTNRICYQYAEFSDLERLKSWYRSQRLIFPEHFIWHVLYSVANALCYCRHGTNSYPPKPGWDSIVHGDIKQENLFLTTPDEETHQFYPSIKLADFGLAYTLGGSVAAVQHYRSRLEYGTDGYIAPEIEDHTPESVGRRRTPRELHGSHSDIYSLGMTCKHLLSLVELHRPTTASHGRSKSGIVQATASHARSKSANIPARDWECLESFYSLELRCLLDLCVARDPLDRPKTTRLYREAKAQMERHQEMALNEAMAARRGESNFKLFHSGILYTQEDQVRYETDSMFREHYQRANLQRLWALIDERTVKKHQQRPSLLKIPSFGHDRGKEKDKEESMRETFASTFLKR